MEKMRLGISACLLGETVRYDAGHWLESFLRDTFGKYFEFVPVCPEVEVGLGVPREPMHLEGQPDSPRLVTVNTRKDLTDRMRGWARRRVEELEKERLSGFIFKSSSPSSGMRRVKVFPSSSGSPARTGVGLFAHAFMAHFPLLPVEDEVRLRDPAVRENFVERLFTMQRWRRVVSPDMQEGARGIRPRGSREKQHANALRQFHARHKLLLMSHSPKRLTLMGAVAARAGSASHASIIREYQELLLDALRLPATAPKHVNVLQHAAGYFKKALPPDDKRELHETIESYRGGSAPLLVPLVLINHYVRKYHEEYLEEQVYLHPHPVELLLRYHA